MATQRAMRLRANGSRVPTEVFTVAEFYAWMQSIERIIYEEE